jgi:hypothetical protein
MKVPSCLVLLAPLIACGHTQPSPTCSPGRTWFDGACVGEAMVDAIKCLTNTRGEQVKSKTGGSLAADAKLFGQQVNTRLELRSELEKRVDSYSDANAGAIIKFCFHQAQSTGNAGVGTSEPAVAASIEVPTGLSAFSTYVRKQALLHASMHVRTYPLEEREPAVCGQANVDKCACLTDELLEDRKRKTKRDIPDHLVYDVVCCDAVGNGYQRHSCGADARCKAAGGEVMCAKWP